MKNQVIFFPYIRICMPKKLPFGLLSRGRESHFPGRCGIRGRKDTSKTLKMYLFVLPSIKCSNILGNLSFLFSAFSPVSAPISAFFLSTPYDTLHFFGFIFGISANHPFFL